MEKAIILLCFSELKRYLNIPRGALIPTGELDFSGEFLPLHGKQLQSPIPITRGVQRVTHACRWRASLIRCSGRVHSPLSMVTMVTHRAPSPW